MTQKYINLSFMKRFCEYNVATIYFIVPRLVYNDWLDFNVPICVLADWYY